MIRISESAAKQIAFLRTQENLKPDSNLRVSVIGGGCSGMSYKMKFDNAVDEDRDKVFVENDIKLVIDKKSYLYLAGTTLEFDGGLNGQGFGFRNPNAKTTCGCGASFSI